MKKSSLIALLPTVIGTTVLAASTQPSFNWNGYYVGANAGAVFSHYNLDTSTQVGPFFTPALANAVNSTGNQSIETSGFISGIGGGYNWQRNHLLIGLESDIQTLSTSNNTMSSAVPYPDAPSNQFVITSYSNNNWLFTARPRIGYVTNNWLFYVTGGLGVTYLQSDFLFSTSEDDFESKQVSKVKPGYVVGAGVETIVTNNISLKAEYLFANFNSTSAYGMNHHIPPGQTFSNSVSLQSNILRLGINYHFNDQFSGLANPTLLPDLLNVNLWETEIGVRLFFSTGVDGAPNPLLSYPGSTLTSRLIFSNLTAISGDTFARADHITGLFAKGYLGAGTITNGQLNDEDFPAGGSYSNTLSNATGNLSYATVDLGYSFLKMPTGNIGAFIGYNYFAQNINSYSCKQEAGSEVCAGNGSEIYNFLGISEDDHFQSLRLGFSTQMDLTNQLTLTSEAAYLPLVNFSGKDMHNARQLMGPEQSTHGDGAMLESVLDYQFSDSWNLGLGGRYWMWNMHNGSVTFDFLGPTGNQGSSPARFNTERYGAFLQLSYRDRKPTSNSWSSPMNWKGLFVGGQMGGAWGKSQWPNPFVSTPADPGLINVAGFGNQIRSTGPLGGINLNYNWQTKQVVYGLGASLSVADIRGENTLYSGLGGVNGETTVNYLSTLVARLGVAANQSLFYVHGGRAMLNTTYKINANTEALSLGSQSDTQNTWGWMGGCGINYALTDHWVSNVEYDYINIQHYTVSLPQIAVINAQQISANQTLNLFKVGLSYKLDL